MTTTTLASPVHTRGVRPHLICHVRVPGDVRLVHGLPRRDGEDVIEEGVGYQPARVQHQGSIVDKRVAVVDVRGGRGAQQLTAVERSYIPNKRFKHTADLIPNIYRVNDATQSRQNVICIQSVTL